MSEETNKSASQDVNAGVQPQADDPIVRAERAAQRIEDGIKKTEELIRKHEEIIARKILGGRAEIAQTNQPVIETPKEYAARILRGGK